MEMIKSKKCKTARRGRTLESTIDLTFATQRLAERVTACKQAKDLDQQSDHWPVATTFDLSIVPSAPKTYPDFKKMDIEGFRSGLKAEFPPQETLRHHGLPRQGRCRTRGADSKGLHHHSPTKRISSFTKAGIDTECNGLMKKCRRAQRKWNKQPEGLNQVQETPQ